MDRTGNHVLSMARLAKDVLAEIPDQFISYMKSRGIKPNPAPPPYTPPGHMHHHTQIWGPPLGLSPRTTACSSRSESHGNSLPPVLLLFILFLGAKRSWRTRKWLLKFRARLLKMTLGAAFDWFLLLFFCLIFLFTSLKRGCTLAKARWVKPFTRHSGGDCLTSGLTASRLNTDHVVVKTCACLWLFL